MRTIAVEEHFVTPELAKYTKLLADLVDPERLEAGGRRLLDLTEERLPEMDAQGIDVAVLSLDSRGSKESRIPARRSAPRGRSTTFSLV